MGMPAPYAGPASGVACPRVTRDPRRDRPRPRRPRRAARRAPPLVGPPARRGALAGRARAPARGPRLPRRGRPARRRDARAADARASWPGTCRSPSCTAGSSGSATSPHGSGMVFNVDCSNRAFGRLDARLADIHERTGRKRRADRPQPRRPLRQGARPPAARARRRRDLARRRARHAVRHLPADEGGRRRRPRGAGPAPPGGLLHRPLRLRVLAPLRRSRSPTRSRSPRSTRAATASSGGRPAWSPTRATSR